MAEPASGRNASAREVPISPSTGLIGLGIAGRLLAGGQAPVVHDCAPGLE